MRDPARIDPFLERLGKIWHKMPDLRFWQVIAYISERFATPVFRQDPFYAEEHDWEEAMDSVIQDIKCLECPNYKTCKGDTK